MSLTKTVTSSLVGLSNIPLFNSIHLPSKRRLNSISSAVKLSLILSCLPEVALANNTTLHATMDAMISSQEPDTKKGLDDYLMVSSEPLSSRTLVQFDLGVLSTAGVTSVDIESATLVLDIEQTENFPQTGDAAQFSLGVHNLILPWAEREVTWRCDTAACSTDWYGGWFNTIESDVSPVADFNGSQWVVSDSTVTFDVTQDVLNALNGGLNNGWLIKKLDEASPGHMVIKSRETDSAPKLIVALSREIDIQSPQITIIAPVDEVFIGEAPSLIDITYSDDVSGIDLTSLQVLLNGTDITSLCAAPGLSSMSCSLPSTMSNGSQVITVMAQDLSGKVGTDSSSFTYFVDQSSSKSQWINDGNNVYTEAHVGIGVSSPSTALHVVGDVTVTGSILAQTIGLSSGATLGSVDVANPNSAASVGFVQGEIGSVSLALNSAVAGLDSQSISLQAQLGALTAKVNQLENYINNLEGSDTSTPPPSNLTGYASCNTIKNANPAVQSGMFTIDPDGDAGIEPFDVYCDMETLGGGWTLTANHADGIVQKVAGYPVNTLEHSVMPDDRWQAVKATMTEGMMFIDEHSNVSMISKSKIYSISSCFGVEDVDSLLIGRDPRGLPYAGLFRVEPACDYVGVDYSIVVVSDSAWSYYTTYGSAIYNLNSVSSFDIWPYNSSVSNAEQNELMHFVK